MFPLILVVFVFCFFWFFFFCWANFPHLVLKQMCVSYRKTESSDQGSADRVQSQIIHLWSDAPTATITACAVHAPRLENNYSSVVEPLTCALCPAYRTSTRPYVTLFNVSFSLWTHACTCMDISGRGLHKVNIHVPAVYLVNI